MYPMAEHLYQDKAEYYDLLYQDKQYADEALFMEQQWDAVATENTHILILGCGTCGHAQHFSDRFELTGMDKHQGMLDQVPEDLDIDLKQTDLPSIAGSQQYGMIVMPFTIINHLDREAMEETLQNCVERLADHGVLLFDNEQPSLDADEQVSDPFLETVDTDDGGIARLTQLHNQDDDVEEFRSVIMTPDGSFIDTHELHLHPDGVIESVLDELPVVYHTKDDGYVGGTKDDGTVFIVEKEPDLQE